MAEAAIMLAYSPMKKSANFIELYSVLIAAHQFLLRFRQVERQPVGFGEGGDQKMTNDNGA